MAEEWRGGATGDQYTADYLTRYPAFSDINTTDYLINKPITTYNRRVVPLDGRQSIMVPTSKEVGPVGSYEQLFEYEQAGRPATMACHLPQCLRGTVYAATQERGGPRESFAPNVLGDSQSVLIVFLFLCLIIICCFLIKSVADMRSQLEIIRELIKK